jgi:hypothetical protein
MNNSLQHKVNLLTVISLFIVDYIVVYFLAKYQIKYAEIVYVCMAAATIIYTVILFDAIVEWNNNHSIRAVIHTYGGAMKNVIRTLLAEIRRQLWSICLFVCFLLATIVTMARCIAEGKIEIVVGFITFIAICVAACAAYRSR